MSFVAETAEAGGRGGNECVFWWFGLVWIGLVLFCTGWVRAGDGQRSASHSEETVACTDGERNPSFLGSSIPAHSLCPFRDLPILLPRHGVLLRR